MLARSGGGRVLLLKHGAEGLLPVHATQQDAAASMACHAARMAAKYIVGRSLLVGGRGRLAEILAAHHVVYLNDRKRLELAIVYELRHLCRQQRCALDRAIADRALYTTRSGALTRLRLHLAYVCANDVDGAERHLSDAERSTHARKRMQNTATAAQAGDSGTGRRQRYRAGYMMIRAGCPGV
jgi:hypothetical protein